MNKKKTTIAADVIINVDRESKECSLIISISETPITREHK
jgi:hypothetical protein